MTDMPDRDERIHAEGEPVSPWEQLRQSFREAVDQAKANHQRQQDLLRQLRPLSVADMFVKMNDIEHELIHVFACKHEREWNDERMDQAIADRMDDWRTIRAEVIRRRS